MLALVARDAAITTMQRSFLVIDDHAPFRAALERSLRPFGTVGHAASCAAGREMIAREPWAALLIDVSLPDGSGLDLLAYLRQKGCTTPALILTAYDKASTLSRASELSADVIVKPGEWNQIADFIRRAIGTSDGD